MAESINHIGFITCECPTLSANSAAIMGHSILALLRWLGAAAREQFTADRNRCESKTEERQGCGLGDGRCQGRILANRKCVEVLEVRRREANGVERSIELNYTIAFISGDGLTVDGDGAAGKLV